MQQLTYRDEHLEIDGAKQIATVDGKALVLTRKELELLTMLATNEGEIIPRDVLLMDIWGYNHEIRTRTLDVHIRRLRKKLGAYGERYIETIFGTGYRFQRFRAPKLVHFYTQPVMQAPVMQPMMAVSA